MTMTDKIRMMLPVVSKWFNTRPVYQKAVTPLMIMHSFSPVSHSQNRTLTTKTLARGIELVTTNKHVATVPNNPLQLAVNTQLAEERPLCILLCWLMSQQKHVLKYARFYLDQGFTCLTVSLTPWQLLWPVTGSQLVAKDILTFLSLNRNYQSTIVHGFSVGGYLWGEALNMMSQNAQKYNPILNQIRGQIWDSVVDMQGIPVGMPFAIFPNNALLRNSLEKYIRYHMAKFHESATKHYNLASSSYHNSILTAPALFLCSLDDSVGSIQGIRTVADKWEAKGIEVFLKAWESSPHVSHLHHHPEEYKLEMKAFLERLQLVPYPEKFLHHVPHSQVSRV